MPAGGQGSCQRLPCSFEHVWLAGGWGLRQMHLCKCCGRLLLVRCRGRRSTPAGSGLLVCGGCELGTCEHPSCCASLHPANQFAPPLPHHLFVQPEEEPQDFDFAWLVRWLRGQPNR